ncbi:phenylacetate-CoA oxygenase subunit PaaJ [Auritidibacter sp. NML120779]|nr:phenylacetate-CoA oxygenase subunit PaaJ [Auritidibacter sp. NML120779]
MGTDSTSPAREPEKTKQAIIRAVCSVYDPEIPVLTIEDLGILRFIDVVVSTAEERKYAVKKRTGQSTEDDTSSVANPSRPDPSFRAHVVITPTYAGCPAMETIQTDVVRAARSAGATDVDVELVFSPAWTTDWMSDEGKAKLAAYGVAPPHGRSDRGSVALNLAVKCPQCHSLNTTEVSRFGSTACKALYRCSDCLEPFDYFKVH